MKNNQNTEEKTCAFYASDYHFEMISLPYIEKNLEKDNEIIVLTENNLQDTINTLLSKTNLKEEKKQKIQKINWKVNDEEKIEKINNNIRNNKDTIIFIKGNKKYIKNMNKNLEKLKNDKTEIKIIDCYNIEEISEEVKDIAKGYNKILKVSGEKEM